MFDKLEKVKERYNEIAELLNKPETVSDQKEFRKLSKEYSDLTEIVNAFDDNSNAEMKELAIAEREELESKFTELESLLKELLVPKDPNDSKNAMLEIRAGTGGEEAALFAADLFRMYTRYAEKKGWKMETVTFNESSGLGGLKEVIVSVTGKDIYGNLKYESGVHRVQRVPETEAQGRVHTSAASIAV